MPESAEEENGGSTETAVQRWADVAMYPAAPIAGIYGGHVTPGEPIHPKVTLVQMTNMPLRTMAAAAELYRGVVVHSPQEVFQSEAESWWEDMSRTILKAPLEFVDLHFLLENVTRALANQLTRQRTAVFVQESQRFAVKEDASWAVGMPPSIAGTADDSEERKIWFSVLEHTAKVYDMLIGTGIPAEDARGLLPTNILTKVHYKTNLRNLIEHGGMRLCTQAQFEWRLVWAGIVNSIREWPSRSFPNRGQSWEFEAIADIFKPVCYRTGKCEFMAATDRYCSIRERVEDFHRAGVPSSEWENEKWGPEQTIQPVQWLANPAAARTRDRSWRE